MKCNEIDNYTFIYNAYENVLKYNNNQNRKVWKSNKI